MQKQADLKILPRDAIPVALARSQMYSFLSTTFLCPGEGGLELIRIGLAASVAALPVLANEGGGKLASGLAALQNRLQVLSGDGLQAEYRRVFGHLISRECPPYETEYGQAHIFGQSQAMADISGFYCAFGLELSSNAMERFDHISTELEFMHFLSFKEAHALEHHGEEQADICRQAQRKFVQEHLGRWVPLFTRLLVDKAGDGFYRALAELSRAFVTWETRHLGVRPRELRPTDFQPGEFDPEGGCFDCGWQEISEIGAGIVPPT
ncbi:MAG: molecular chaperone [Anaerolineae bacterium]